MEPTITYEKVSENELRITKEQVISEEEVVTLTELKQRKLNTLNAIEGIQRQLDEQNDILSALSQQIAQAENLGVKEEAVEVRDIDSGAVIKS